MADGSDDPRHEEDIGLAPTLDGRQTEQLDDAPAPSSAGAHPTPASSREAETTSEGRGRGDILEGVYEVIDVLSEAGGMARVFLARDLRLGRQVVVKMTRFDTRDPEKRALFEREARATARLKHRHIVTIHAFGFWGDSPYMVLEYLEGQSLRQRLDNGILTEPDALRTMIPLARALQHAHERGVYHRDIKPDNIFLEDSGEVKLLDFGISDFNLDKEAVREALEGGAGDLLDGTPAVAGTPGFMAPEQWRGQAQDSRTDVWGIGATLYCMLGGQCPYPPEVPTRLFTDGVPSIGELCPDIHADTIDLIDRCLRVDPSERFQSADALLEALEQARSAVTSRGELTGAPYRYLQPFDESDDGWFFGRDAETARLARLVESNALTALIGPSGAGKSSLVRAGLLPKLRERGRVDVLHVRPEGRPLDRLRMELAAFAEADTPYDEASLLAQPGIVGRVLRSHATDEDADILLFVDQLEELFTGSIDATRRQAFVDAIASASDDPRSRVRVVVTMREDFLSRLAAFPTLQRRVTESLLLLGAPDRDSQRAMLVKPAERLGFEWPEAVVTRVLEQVEDDPTPLPSLQIAASRLWELRDEDARTIPPDALDRIGGVGGALSSHADEVIERLQSQAELRVAREIFCILVGREQTRRAMPREDLLERFFDRASAAGVLEQLIAGRLIAVSSFEGATTVELAHDALIERWDRLERWLHEDAESRRLRERLAEAARHWDSEGRPSELLWEGETLRRTLDWEDADARDLSVIEHDFLEDSRQSVDRRVWLRRWGFIVVFALVGGGFYLLGNQGHDDEKDDGHRYLATAAQLLSVEPDLAAAFALRAVEDEPGSNSATVLHDALARDHLIQRHRVDAGVRGAVFSPIEDAYLTVPSSGFSLAFRDLGPGENQPVGVQGRLGAATKIDGVGTLFHRRNKSVHGIWCEAPDLPRRGTNGHVFAADGHCKFPATSEDRRRIDLVVANDGGIEENRIDGEWETLNYVEMSRDGRHLLIVGTRASDDGGDAARTIDVRWTTDEPLYTLETSETFELARLVPDREGSVLIASSEKPGETTRLELQPTPATDIDRSEEDTDTAAPISTVVPLSSENLRAEFVPGGGHVVLRDEAGRVQVLAISESGFEAMAEWHDIDRVGADAPNTVVLVQGPDLHLADPSGRIRTTLRHEAAVRGWRWTPTQSRLITWTSTRVRVWSSDGEPLAESVAGASIRGVASRDEGRRMLVSTDAGVELHEVWGRPEGVLLQLDNTIDTFRFSSDSKRLIAADVSGSVQSIRLDGEAWRVEAIQPPVFGIRPDDDGLALLSRSRGGLVVHHGGEDTTYRLPEKARVEDAGWDPSGQYVWATGSPPFLAAWQREDGERTLFELDDPVREMRLDGYSGWFFLVTGQSEGRVGSFNGALNPPIEWTGSFQDLAFLDSGLCIGAIDDDGDAILAQFGDVESETELDADGIVALAFAPDGERVATLDRHGDIVLWSLDGSRLREVGRAPGAETLAFEPNGAVLAASRPGATWLWQNNKRREVARLPAGTDALTADSFSPDGRFIALPDRQGGLQIYALRVDLLRDIARNQVVRELSAADYARFGLPNPIYARTR